MSLVIKRYPLVWCRYNRFLNIGYFLQNFRGSDYLVNFRFDRQASTIGGSCTEGVLRCWSVSKCSDVVVESGISVTSFMGCKLAFLGFPGTPGFSVNAQNRMGVSAVK